jgi:nitroimidazol reductase NimA-like FMN-containing flavoprotein (pyridoxamine 5'-phosphate oxidase superfamily)
VCFEFEHGVKLVPHAEDPCKWTFSFQSVIGYGRIQELVSAREKTEGLNQVMGHYSGKEWALGEIRLDNIRVWQIRIESTSGKQSKDKSAP